MIELWLNNTMCITRGERCCLLMHVMLAKGTRCCVLHLKIRFLQIAKWLLKYLKIFYSMWGFPANPLTKPYLLKLIMLVFYAKIMMTPYFLILRYLSVFGIQMQNWGHCAQIKMQNLSLLLRLGHKHPEHCV